MTTRFIDHLLEGDHASRPAFGDVPQGTLYACSTHDLIYQSDGSAWSTWSDVSGASGGVLTTQGDILYRDGSGLQRLAIGTAGQVLKTNSGATAPEWDDESGGGGGSGATMLPLDVPPGSAHAKDDEFNGSSLDGKWTDPWTSTRTNTIAVANGFLILEPSDAGSSAVSTRGPYAIRQAAPTGSFTVMAKVIDGRPADVGGAADDVRAGLLMERLTSTAQAVAFGHHRDSAGAINTMATWLATPSHTADWSAWDGTQTITSGALATPQWLKLVWDSGSSTVTYFRSFDGFVWTQTGSRGSRSQPEYIGVGLWSNSTDIRADHKIAVDWFRVTEP